MPTLNHFLRKKFLVICIDSVEVILPVKHEVQEGEINPSVFTAQIKRVSRQMATFICNIANIRDCESELYSPAAKKK